MKARNFGEHPFEFAATIQLVRDGAGNIVEYKHNLPPGVRSNRHASGPFCRFELSGARNAAGVYALTASNILKYIGECENLATRFGASGYGQIAERNCHHDGQATNCKVNSYVLASTKRGDRIDVWFHETPRRKEVEAELLDLLKPPWNDSRGQRPGRDMQTGRGPTMTSEGFRVALEREFNKATRARVHSVRIRAGDLHRIVGGYPGKEHRMPVCCQVMQGAMASGDRVVERPPSGKGASLTIEYRLPRPA